MSIHKTAGSASVYLQQLLDRNTTAYGKVMEQLSSGYKFTSVGDDPVGVTKTAELDVKIGVNSVVSDNVAVGKDLLLMASEAEDNVMNNLQRIQDLVLQIANETNTTEGRDGIIAEIRGRLQSIDYISNSTNFAEVNLLDGSASNLVLQIGAESGATLDVGVALINVNSTVLGGDITLDPSVTGDNWSESDITAYLDSIQLAMQEINTAQGQAGGFLKRLDYTSSTLSTVNENLEQLQSSIADVDVAAATSELIKYQILQQASASVLTQSNQVASWALDLLRK